MRQALEVNRARAQTAISRPVPAPTGGWDTESPLAAMPAKNAIILDNWIARASYIEMRRGSKQHVTGTDDPVESLIIWRGDDNGDQILACAGSNIYETTAAASLSSAIWTSASTARWKSTNFANDAGRFALACNGFDTPIKYDGSSLAELAITGSSGAVTLDPVNLFDVIVHKRRAWWLEKNSLRAWYLETNAIQGPAGLQDMGPIFNKGGSLAAQATWSLDGGAGMDDVLVFITSEGQVAIYQGLDPSDASQWSLVGVFDTSKPIGGNCVMKAGADLYLLTEDGVLPLSQVLDKDRAQNNRVALTAKIATAFSKAVGDYGDLYGWGMTLYTGRGSLAIVNVPTAEGSTAVQFVQSMQGGGWSRFTGLNAICWGLANGEIYFGAADGVYQWDVGASDNGNVITSDVKPAFSAFGFQSRQKKFTLVRPLMKAPAAIKPALEVLVDYTERVPTAVPTIVSQADILASDQDEIRFAWTGASGFGTVAAPRMRISIIGSDAISVIAVTADGSDTLTTGDGYDVVIEPTLPVDVEIQLIGFDVMFKVGSSL